MNKFSAFASIHFVNIKAYTYDSNNKPSCSSDSTGSLDTPGFIEIASGVCSDNFVVHKCARGVARITNKGGTFLPIGGTKYFLFSTGAIRGAR
jgi:hypothetical protein